MPRYEARFLHSWSSRALKEDSNNEEFVARKSIRGTMVSKDLQGHLGGKGKILIGKNPPLAILIELDNHFNGGSLGNLLQLIKLGRVCWMHR